MNKSTVNLPPKVSFVPFSGAFCNIMPAYIKNNQNIAGIKAVTRFPAREPSLDSKLLLVDMNTGKFLAIMDANWITTMRTGAVAAHSIKLFSKKDFYTVGIIGLGNTVRATLLALAELVKNREIMFKLYSYKGQEKLLKERFSHIKNFKFEYVNSYIDTIKDSDVIISATTYFDSDICHDKYYKEGVTVIPIHTRGFTNCDLFFDKVFADDTGHVTHFKNFGKFKKFAEVADVVNGVSEGRKNDQERIIVYNIGIAMHDIYYATNIYNLLDKSKIQNNIDFKEPNEKFWV